MSKEIKKLNDKVKKIFTDVLMIEEKKIYFYNQLCYITYKDDKYYVKRLHRYDKIIIGVSDNQSDVISLLTALKQMQEGSSIEWGDYQSDLQGKKSLKEIRKILFDLENKDVIDGNELYKITIESLKDLISFGENLKSEINKNERLEQLLKKKRSKYICY